MQHGDEADTTIKCHICGALANKNCQKCGKPYCDNHGDIECHQCALSAARPFTTRIYLGTVATAVLLNVLVLYYFFASPTSAIPSKSPATFELVRKPTRQAIVSELIATATPTVEAIMTTTPTATLTPQPTATEIPISTATPVPTPTETPVPVFLYTVQPGDTLFDIAITYKISVGELMELNEIEDETLLQIGQVLKIPEKGE